MMKNNESTSASEDMNMNEKGEFEVYQGRYSESIHDELEKINEIDFLLLCEVDLNSNEDFVPVTRDHQLNGDKKKRKHLKKISTLINSNLEEIKKEIKEMETRIGNVSGTSGSSPEDSIGNKNRILERKLKEGLTRKVNLEHEIDHIDERLKLRQKEMSNILRKEHKQNAIEPLNHLTHHEIFLHSGKSEIIKNKNKIDEQILLEIKNFIPMQNRVETELMNLQNLVDHEKDKFQRRIQQQQDDELSFQNGLLQNVNHTIRETRKSMIAICEGRMLPSTKKTVMETEQMKYELGYQCREVKKIQNRIQQKEIQLEQYDEAIIAHESQDRSFMVKSFLQKQEIKRLKKLIDNLYMKQEKVKPFIITKQLDQSPSNDSPIASPKKEQDITSLDQTTNNIKMKLAKVNQNIHTYNSLCEYMKDQLKRTKTRRACSSSILSKFIDIGLVEIDPYYRKFYVTYIQDSTRFNNSKNNFISNLSFKHGSEDITINQSCITETAFISPPRLSVSSLENLLHKLRSNTKTDQKFFHLLLPKKLRQKLCVKILGQICQYPIVSKQNGIALVCNETSTGIPTSSRNSNKDGLGEISSYSAYCAIKPFFYKHNNLEINKEHNRSKDYATHNGRLKRQCKLQLQKSCMQDKFNQHQTPKPIDYFSKNKFISSCYDSKVSVSELCVRPEDIYRYSPSKRRQHKHPHSSIERRGIKSLSKSTHPLFEKNDEENDEALQKVLTKKSLPTSSGMIHDKKIDMCLSPKRSSLQSRLVKIPTRCSKDTMRISSIPTQKSMASISEENGDYDMIICVGKREEYTFV